MSVVTDFGKFSRQTVKSLRQTFYLQTCSVPVFHKISVERPFQVNASEVQRTRIFRACLLRVDDAVQLTQPPPKLTAVHQIQPVFAYKSAAANQIHRWDATENHEEYFLWQAMQKAVAVDFVRKRSLNELGRTR